MKRKKLTLSRETIRQLNSAELSRVGGAMAPTTVERSTACTDSCNPSCNASDCCPVSANYGCGTFKECVG